MIVTGYATPSGIRLRHPASSICCGEVTSSVQIPWSTVLKCECVSESTSVWKVWYVDTSSKPYRLVNDQFRLKTGDEEGLLHGGDQSPGEPPAPKRLVIFINPSSGPGHARKKFHQYAEPVFEAAQTQTRIIETSYSGEAGELVESLDMSEWDGIVCVSGDGTPHEVINGLARRPDAEEALKHFGIAQLPAGSGNAMAHSLNDGVAEWALAALNIVKGTAQPVDLMAVTQGNTKFLSFLSTSYGIVADCDLGTEDWRWMGGARFTVGIVLKSLAQNVYPCEVAFLPYDPEEAATHPSSLDLKYGSVLDPVPDNWVVEPHPNLSMFYVGKMPWMSADAYVFPHARPTDGAMDIVLWDTSMGRVKALTVLSQFEKGTHADSGLYRKIAAFRLIPKLSDAYLSIDGEQYPCEPMQVEVLPRVARFYSVDSDIPLS